MTEIEEIKKYLSESLSKKRYKHSLGVADEAVRLAEHYGADKDKAYLAGLCHDVAKEIKEEEAKELLKGYGFEINEIMKSSHKLLHGPLGVFIVKDKFKIEDEEILDAIAYHTTSKANMPLLTKILYIADYIEPNRDFDGVDDLRELSYKDIDAAIILGIDWTIEELIEKKAVFHPDTIHARNYLLIHMKK